MSRFQLALVLLGICSVSFGFVGIARYRSLSETLKMYWRRRLTVALVLVLGGLALLAAWHRQHGLLSLGLILGLVVMTVLWDGSPDKTSIHITR